MEFALAPDKTVRYADRRDKTDKSGADAALPALQTAEVILSIAKNLSISLLPVLSD